MNQKNKLFSPKNKVILVISVTLLLLLVFSLPAFAVMYRYSGTYFKYVGDIFHQRVVDFDGGKAGFQITGQGEVSGSHEVTSVRYEGSAAEQVYDASAANLSLYLYGTTAKNAPSDKKVKMIAGLTVNGKAKTDVTTGVEMNQGESGYIKQSVVTDTSGNGEYLNVTNNFGNTGGITKRNMEVKGFLNDTMSVNGYADVYETTTVSDGKTSSGWWKALP